MQKLFLCLEDCRLIPEFPFYMDGEGGSIQYIERRLKENMHMVIVVAEGACQDIIAKSIPSSEQQDAYGNKLILVFGLLTRLRNSGRHGASEASGRARSVALRTTGGLRRQ